VRDVFILDACALIAILNDEEGSQRVDYIFQEAEDKKCLVYMNKLNLFEVYYTISKRIDVKRAEEVLSELIDTPLIIIDRLEDDVFKEAGRLKTKYKISLADSIALAEAKVKEAQLVTSDHHEFDIIDENDEVKFYWIR